MTERPLFIEKELNRWQRPESPKPGTALVFIGDGKPSLAVYEGERGPTQGELLWGNYSLYYEVDMGDRSINFYEKLPSSDAFEFQAEVRLNYAVSNPNVILQCARTDADQFLKNLAIDVMRRTSRNYNHAQSGEAEVAIARRIEEEVRDNGFKLSRSPFIKLSLDEAIRTRLISRQLNAQDFEDRKTQIKRQSEIDELKQTAKLTLKGKRAEVLAPLIESGNWQTLLAMLDPHDPADEAMRQMIAAILDQQREREANRRKLLEIAIEKGALEGWQLEDYAKTLFQEMSGLSDQSITFLEGKTNPQGELPSAQDEDSLAPIPNEISRDEDS
jgi:hypothetical protein